MFVSRPGVRRVQALDEKLAQDDNQDARRQRRKSRRGSHSARPMSRVSTGSRRSSEGDLDVHATTPKKDPSIKSITDNTPEPNAEVLVREFLQINDEDKPMVEGQRPEDLPLDLTEEIHIPADRMSVEYRRALAKLGLGAPIAS